MVIVVIIIIIIITVIIFIVIVIVILPPGEQEAEWEVCSRSRRPSPAPASRGRDPDQDHHVQNHHDQNLHDQNQIRPRSPWSSLKAVGMVCERWRQYLLPDITTRMKEQQRWDIESKNENCFFFNCSKKPTPYSNSKALVQDYLHSGLVLHVNCALFSAIYSKSCLGHIYQQTLQYLLKYVEWLFVGWRLYKLPIFPGRPTSFGGKSLRKKTPLGADGWKLLSVIIHERP